MYCSNCGFNMKDDAAFCPNCGNTSKSDKKISQPTAQPVAKNNDSKKGNRSLFISPDEKMIAVLGGGFSDNLLKTGQLINEYCVVSNKRIYLKGKCYGINGKALSKAKEECVVDLKDVTSSGFTQISHIVLLIIAFLFFVCFTILALFIQFAAKDVEGATLPIFSTGIGFSSIFFIIYNVMKVKMFQITYPGGSLIFKASKYSYSSIQEFQKSLRLAVDKRNEEIYRIMAGTDKKIDR